MVYIHGGGWVVGDLDSHQHQAARIGLTAPATIVQVDYRRAPEHPWPAAYDDCRVAVRWVSEHLGELGARRLVLAGDSAGGQLALSTALWCRDTGIDVAAVLVNYPAVDLTHERDDQLPATYRPTDGTPLTDPGISPTFGDLAGLPPVVIGIGGLDFLVEDVLTFAHKLRSAGVPTTLRIFPSLPHAYFSLAQASRAADRAAERVCRDLNAVLWDGLAL